MANHNAGKSRNGGTDQPHNHPIAALWEAHFDKHQTQTSNYAVR